MKVLGIDPGLAITGYACVEPRCPDVPGADLQLIEAGCFRFNARFSVSARLVELERDLDAVLHRLSPDVMSVESLFSHSRHPRTAIIMAHARGVILLVAQRAGVPVVELPPAEVKKALTGSGRATKAQVQQAVAAQFNLVELPEPPDIADAIAVALCGLTRSEADQTIRASQ